jgi:hypothetical protein
MDALRARTEHPEEQNAAESEHRTPLLLPVRVQIQIKESQRTRWRSPHRGAVPAH